MAPTDDDPGVLNPAHLPDLMALSREAGWNQCEEDWRLFLSEGAVFGIVDAGRVVGSAAIMPYGKDLAWIGMVLVLKSHRRRGIATRLLKACLDEIDRQNRTAFLDATPEGEPVYRALGFEGDLRITRWQGQASKGGSSPASRHNSEAMNTDHLEEALALDLATLGVRRNALLSSFARRLPEAARVPAKGRGAIFGRDGDLACQIGPLFAEDEDVASELLSDVLAALKGRVFIDVIDGRTKVVKALEDQGFVPQRPFLRMSRGVHKPSNDISRLFAIAGPEFG
ncbi:GNAT family N-acetyltransferase [Chelativorans sp. YIM 93263]|uniref:GNAT family N-acetyltransferase n=1 Tax=Chelativorans sp. YIM 93263 TaxID=2906648 RepID=UPI0023787595|nr:GNAT family N-acetyltransferase [Chelativorans sp. YIM 93263]